MNNPTHYRNGLRLGNLLAADPLRMLDDLLTWQPPGSEVVWSAFRAPLNVTQTDDGATVSVDMPGVDPKDLDLTFENGMLAITGRRGEQMINYSVALGNTIDPDAIEAQLDKGVLTVRAHKRPEAKPRKIAVGSADRALASGEAK